MATIKKNGPQYENRPSAEEPHNLPTHKHRVAEHGKDQEHLTAHEKSRNAQEHSHETGEHLHAGTVGHGISAFGHDDIAALAYRLWQERGSPEGSPEEDWFQATKELRNRNIRKAGASG